MRASEPIASTSADGPARVNAQPGVDISSDFPAWALDAVVPSERFRLVLTALRPILLRVLRYWDQRVRRLTLRDGRAIIVADSGCYRVE